MQRFFLRGRSCRGDGWGLGWQSQVAKNLIDRFGIQDGSDNFQVPFAVWAGRDIDIENSL
ncbi:MAG: hypothetical protein HQ462_11195 [Deltaproteobacteria bacterium]|nr:hypothetical protein [Deltaproteobacteria bacterium]